MITPEQYSAAFNARAAARGRAYSDHVGPVQASVGLSSEFVGLARMHICAVLAVLDRVDGFVVDDFLRHVTAYADRTTSGIRGLGTLVCALGGIVSARIDPTAVQAANRTPDAQWGGDSRPVVVDVTTGAVHTFVGTRVWGSAFAGTITNHVHRCYPTPGEVAYQFSGPAPPGPGLPPGYGAPPG